MSVGKGTVGDYVDLLRRKAPEYVDLLSAENEEQFENAFDALLEKAIAGLERNKSNFKTLNEESLSAVLELALNMPGLTVTRETHSNGHVDLTIEAEHCFPARRKLGEAKIYDGPAYHVKGLEQLLGRYTTGREGRGLLIVYFRRAGIGDLVRKLREKLDADRPVQQRGPTEDHVMKWSFLSVHGHSCGDNVQVGHVGCNLYVE